MAHDAIFPFYVERLLPAHSRFCEGNGVHGDVLIIDESTNRVIWFCEGGGRILRQFTCECRPLEAILCNISSEKYDDDSQNAGTNNTSVGILLTPHCLRLHLPTGESFDVQLPVPIERIYPIPRGILLQSNPVAQQGLGIPTLYTLTHPSAPIAPVSLPLTLDLDDSMLDPGISIDHSRGEHNSNMDASRSRSRSRSGALDISTTPGNLRCELFTSVDDKVAAVFGNFVCTSRWQCHDVDSGTGRSSDKVGGTWYISLWCLRESRHQHVQATCHAMPVEGFESYSKAGGIGVIGIEGTGSAAELDWAHTRALSPQSLSKSDTHSQSRMYLDRSGASSGTIDSGSSGGGHAGIGSGAGSHLHHSAGLTDGAHFQSIGYPSFSSSSATQGGRRLRSSSNAESPIASPVFMQMAGGGGGASGGGMGGQGRSSPIDALASILGLSPPSPRERGSSSRLSNSSPAAEGVVGGASVRRGTSAMGMGMGMGMGTGLSMSLGSAGSSSPLPHIPPHAIAAMNRGDFLGLGLGGAAVMDSLSASDSSLLLLDSIPLTVPLSPGAQTNGGHQRDRGLEITFSGSKRLLGGLHLHVLHRSSGTYQCFEVQYETDAEEDVRAEGRQAAYAKPAVLLPMDVLSASTFTSTGHLVPLPLSLSLSGSESLPPVLSVAHILAPLEHNLSCRGVIETNAPVRVPLSLLLHADGRFTALLAGESLGQYPLVVGDDLAGRPPELLLQPNPQRRDASQHVFKRRDLQLVSICSMGSHVLLQRGPERHVLALPPCLLQGTTEGNSRVAEAILFSLQSEPEKQDAAFDATGPLRVIVKESGATLQARGAALAIGLLLLSEKVISREDAAFCVLSAALGRPTPALLSSESDASKQSDGTKIALVSAYSSLFSRLASESTATGVQNVGHRVFTALHAIWQDLNMRGKLWVQQGHFRTKLLYSLASALQNAAHGDPALRLYETYYRRRSFQLLNAATLAPGSDSGTEMKIEDIAAPPRRTHFFAAAWAVACVAFISEQARLLESESDLAEEELAEVTAVKAPLENLLPKLSLQCMNNENTVTGALKPVPSLRLMRDFFKGILRRIESARRRRYRRRLDEPLDGVSWPRVFVGAFVQACRRQGGGTLELLQLLPLSLQALVEVAMGQCQADCDARWPEEVLLRVGRNDLCSMLPAMAAKGTLRDSSGLFGASHAGGDSIASPSRTKSSSIQPSQSPAGSRGVKMEEPVASDGLSEVEAASYARFAADDRMTEVCRMLRSSKSTYLRVEKAPEVSDLDHRHKLQLRLLTLCRRSLAAPVGRGMLCMGSLVPLMAEALPVPPLVLSGRVPPNDSIIALDTASAPPELTLWPEFHNGVAAGLRVGVAKAANASVRNRISGRVLGPQSDAAVGPMGPRGEGRRGGEQSKGGLDSGGGGVTRNWILYNRTAANGEVEAASHAGLLLALGLQGHLRVLAVADICDYLTQGYEPTTIAMLIGISASRLGSADSRLSKTLCLHIPSLLPPRHWDLEISPLVQTAALTGLGLLHAGTGHRLITEFLLAELSRKPTSDRCEAREALALGAAWALGMVLLGRGADPTGLGGLADLRIEDRLYLHIDGGKRPPDSLLFPSSMPAIDSNSKSFRVLETDDINTEVTAMGACIALSLMFFRSNNAEVAKRLTVPTTVYALDNLRPDLLLYRAMGVCLVMWDSVVPSTAWLDEQVPLPVRRAIFGDVSEERLHAASQLTPKVAISAYLSILTGYCLGIALVYAGTADDRPKDVIISKLKVMQSFRENKPSIKVPGLVVEKSLRPLIDLCVSVTSLSLSVVMAGTGDIVCLRILRELRWRVDDVNYGTHLALSMAIGMLFLAGGSASLKRDPVSIACLVLSIVPRFPSRTVDNQYHLQALRHMYVLAVENRLLTAVDADSGTSVSVDVDVLMKDGSYLRRTTPCLLPELVGVEAVRYSNHNVVEGAAGRSRQLNYYPVTLQIHPQGTQHNWQGQGQGQGQWKHEFGHVQGGAAVLVLKKRHTAPLPRSVLFGNYLIDAIRKATTHAPSVRLRHSQQKEGHQIGLDLLDEEMDEVHGVDEALCFALHTCPPVVSMLLRL